MQISLTYFTYTAIFLRLSIIIYTSEFKNTNLNSTDNIKVTMVCIKSNRNHFKVTLSNIT
jgi:hypothetical protein